MRLKGLSLMGENGSIKEERFGREGENLQSKTSGEGCNNFKETFSLNGYTYMYPNSLIRYCISLLRDLIN